MKVAGSPAADPAAAGAALALVASLARCPELPTGAALAQASADAMRAMDSVPDELRPRNAKGDKGGLVRVSGDRDVYLVPDLHARPRVLFDALRMPAVSGGGTVADAMAEGRAALVALGDLMHSETEADLPRWRRAFAEFEGGFRARVAMAEEAALGLSVAMQVLALLAAFPRSFACLKGNHDNCVNERAHGDAGFVKYVREGEMSAEFLRLSYRHEVVEAYRAFELALPLVALGPRFAASHSEPALPLSERDIVEARADPEREREIVYSLIWTRNDEAPEGNVGATLEALLPGAGAKSSWIAGHRPVAGLYALRAKGRLAQIHANGRERIAVVRSGDFFKPDRDIFDITTEAGATR